MGYYVRPLKGKSTFPHWKLQFVSYKKKDTMGSTAAKPKKEWDIARSRWPFLGFSPAMNLEQAKARAKQLNARLDMKRQEERRQRIETQERELAREFTASLPEVFKAEFEQKHLFSRYSDRDSKRRFLMRLAGGPKDAA